MLFWGFIFTFNLAIGICICFDAIAPFDAHEIGYLRVRLRPEEVGSKLPRLDCLLELPFFIIFVNMWSRIRPQSWNKLISFFLKSYFCFAKISTVFVSNGVHFLIFSFQWVLNISRERVLLSFLLRHFQLIILRW